MDSCEFQVSSEKNSQITPIGNLVVLERCSLTSKGPSEAQVDLMERMIKRVRAAYAHGMALMSRTRKTTVNPKVSDHN